MKQRFEPRSWMSRNRKNQRLPRRRQPRPLLRHRRVLQLPPPQQARKNPRFSGLSVSRLLAWSVVRIGEKGSEFSRLRKSSVGARDRWDERDGGGFEVRSSRFSDFEPRTSNYGSRLSRMSRASRFDKLTVPSQVEGRATVRGGGGLFQHPISG